MEIRIFIEPQQGATYEDQARVARATQEAGLDGFFRSDHVLAIGEGADPGAGPTDTWVTLGAIARETSKIRLGSLLSAATFRHPGLLAIAVAQVDAMSGGRVECGLGAAWYHPEHLAYGIPFPPTVSERLSRLEEQLEIITGIWAAPVGGGFHFSGAFYELGEGPALPKPVQPKIPVIVGGHGMRRTPALAARFADEFNLPFEGVESATRLFGALDLACDALGRDRSEVVRSVALTTVIGADEAECRHRAGRIGRDLGSLSEKGLAGTPKEVARRLETYAETGVSRVYLQLLDLADLDQIALIGAELAPLIDGLSGAQ